MTAEAIHVKRDGTVTYGRVPIGRVVREANREWSPIELNGDYLGMTSYQLQSDAAIELARWWRAREETIRRRAGRVDP